MKPAYEPIILARKPGPMRELGIEECRVAGTPETTRFDPAKHSHDGWRMDATGAEVAANASPSGRWPANLVLECTCDETREGTAGTNHRDNKGGYLGYRGGNRPDMAYGNANGKEPVRIHTDPNCPCAMLDGQTGDLTRWFNKPRSGEGKTGRELFGEHTGDGAAPTLDSGGASRFFYCAKASRSERNAGCEGMPERDAFTLSGGEFVAEGRTAVKGKARAQNHHPTVKPLALMRWLVKLVAQPGDVVLDPFMGSGTTGVACAELGRRFIGIEREAEYMEIARRRIEAASAQTRLPVG